MQFNPLSAISATILVFNILFYLIKSLFLGAKCVFKHDVVGRGSETQFGVGENLNRRT